MYKYVYLDTIILSLDDLVKCKDTYVSVSDYIVRAYSFMRLYSLPSVLDTPSPLNP